MKKLLIDRFNKKYKINPKTNCWLWTACKDKDGYGRINNGTTMSPAHRISYELFIGPIPNKLLILHTCDNPPCVNPDHLFLGTHQDNATDMKNKKRQIYGEQIHISKLTDEKIKQIIIDLKTNGILSIANKFGVCTATISNIKNNKIWKHISRI